MWKRSLARLFNLAISALFGCAFELWATARRRLGGEKAGTCIVLYYHEVRSENRLRFARQMDMLLRYTQPVHADHVIPLSANKRYAAVTFDDGYLNVIENAIPELEKRRIRAVTAIPANARPVTKGRASQLVDGPQLGHGKATSRIRGSIT